VVVGRPALITRLLVWALAIVAIDGAVIARGNDREAATPSARGSSTTATTAASSTTAGETSTLETTPTSETTTSITSSGEVVVAHLQGDGNTAASAGFHVEGRWQLRWRVDQGGNGVAATVEDDTGAPKTFAGLTPGEGTLDISTGCSCTLHLTPDGSAYNVLVVDVEG
jgi:hypothetical protein